MLLATGSLGQDFVEAAGAEAAEVEGDVLETQLAEAGVDFRSELRIGETRELFDWHFDARQRVVMAYAALAETQLAQERFSD